ncbi:MAG: RIO1 family regulatory kinase/ATPase [Promethearchaeota archaeon]
MEAAKLLTNLEKEDFRILMAIEIGMKRSEYVKVNDIRFYSRYPIEETMYRLNRVHKFDLIIRNNSKHDIGYTLNSKAYDLLALRALVEKGLIAQLGPLLGKGKESDVYSCMDEDQNIYALKLYRMGRTSFKNIKRLRDLVGNRTHLSWLYVNRLAARREYQALSNIYTLNLNTPRPIAYNRHALLMEYLRGKELVYYEDIDDPQYIFEQIIDQVYVIFKQGKLIHGDLGEFNIVLDQEGNILIIDWLQSVPNDHPNARSLLERDIQNVSTYFRRKFKIDSDAKEIVNSFFEA